MPMDSGVERVILPLPETNNRTDLPSGQDGCRLCYSAKAYCLSDLPQVRRSNGACRIFPDRPGYDQRTYECPKCEYELTELVRFK